MSFCICAVHQRGATLLKRSIFDEELSFLSSSLKVVSTTLVLVCFLSLKKALVKLGKMFSNSLRKLFSFSRKSNFRILHFQISWRHQMPKHKTRNTFHWITCKVNSLLMKFDQFMSNYKRKNPIKKLYKNCRLKTSSRPFCICKEWSITSFGKWNLWSKLLKIRYVILNLSKFVRISMPTSTESFLQRILWKLERTWN